MVTRDLANCTVIPAFDIKAIHSCTVTGFTSACGTVSTGGALGASWSGFCIDRLGLPFNYNSVIPLVSVFGTIQSSSTASKADYLGVSVGIQHASSTAGDWADFSTGEWGAKRALTIFTTTTTTSTGGTGNTFPYTWKAREISDFNIGTLTTGISTSSSTGYAALIPANFQPVTLTGAKRYLRMLIAPHVETTGCGGSFMNVSGSFLFGNADESPSAAPWGRVLVTSGCSTSTAG